jgi:hypothetical protein
MVRTDQLHPIHLLALTLILSPISYFKPIFLSHLTFLFELYFLNRSLLLITNVE